MSKEEKVQYWLTSSDKDWKVTSHLFEKGDYSYALFFGHLTVEKLLKAIFVSKFDESPPFTHRLVYLAEKVGINLSEEKLTMLEIITRFNLEARYPDEKFSFHQKCTRKFTLDYMEKIEELKEWLLQQIQQ